MKKNASKVLKLGLMLLLAGAVLFLIGSAILGFDYTKLDTHEYVLTTVLPEEAFTAVGIKQQTTDVHIYRAQDGVCRVKLVEDKDYPSTVSVKDGVLTIEQPKNEKWSLFSFHFKKTYVNLYLPEESYEALNVECSTGDVLLDGGVDWGAMNISTSTGDIKIDNTVAGTMALSLSTGDTSVSNTTVKGAMRFKSSTGDAAMSSLTCDSFEAETSTGDIALRNVTIAGQMVITSTTGDILLQGADAESLMLTTTTGDVTGHILSAKRFETQTDTGDVRVPYGTADAGLCRIVTDTGDIVITEP